MPISEWPPRHFSIAPPSQVRQHSRPPTTSLPPRGVRASPVSPIRRGSRIAAEPRRRTHGRQRVPPGHPLRNRCFWLGRGPGNARPPRDGVRVHRGPVRWGCRPALAPFENLTIAPHRSDALATAHKASQLDTGQHRAALVRRPPGGFDGAAWPVGRLVGSCAEAAISPVLSTTNGGCSIRSHAMPPGASTTVRAPRHRPAGSSSPQI